MPIQGTKRLFTDSEINRVPPVRGVYALYRGNTLTYYGSSEHVPNRLRDHKAGRSGSCTQHSSHFAWEAHPNPPAREAQLLREYVNANGRLPSCNDVRS